MIMKKLFLITSQEIAFDEIKEGILALSDVWGGGVKEISSEEFPFENLNNMTSVNGLILLSKILLDKIFLRVLKNNPEKMPKIFYDMFQGSSNKIIKFLSNKSNFFDDLSIIMKMPKLLFLKALI